MALRKGNYLMKKEIVVGLLVFILSTPLGYMLNSFLSRDRLSIENVELIPVKTRIRFDRARLAEINDFVGMNGYNSGFVFMNLNEILDEQQKSMLLNQLLTKEASTEVGLRNLEKSLELAEKYPVEAPIEGLFSQLPTNSYPYPYFGNDVKEMTIDRFKTELQNNIDRHANHLENVKSFIESLQAFEGKKTGDFELIVTVLNAGDTDSLVKYEGEICLSKCESKIALKLKEDEPNKALPYHLGPPEQLSSTSTSVSKRSMLELKFKVDAGNSGKTALSEIGSKIINDDEFKYSLTLFDFRKDKIQYSGQSTQSN